MGVGKKVINIFGSRSQD